MPPVVWSSFAFFGHLSAINGLSQAAGLPGRARRLRLPDHAGRPDEEDLPYLARVCSSAIRVVQADAPGMSLVYGQGFAALTVE